MATVYRDRSDGCCFFAHIQGTAAHIFSPALTRKQRCCFAVRNHCGGIIGAMGIHNAGSGAMRGKWNTTI